MKEKKKEQQYLVLNLELTEGQLLNTDMEALKEFFSELPKDDLLDVHNMIVRLVNNHINIVMKRRTHER